MAEDQANTAPKSPKIPPPGLSKKHLKKAKERKIKKAKEAQKPVDALAVKPEKKKKNKKVRKAKAAKLQAATAQEKPEQAAAEPDATKSEGKQQPKLTYLHRVLSTLWHAIKGLKSYLMRKYSKKTGKSKSQDDEGAETPAGKQKMEKKLQALKKLTIYDSKLLMAILLRFQLNEDLDRYWSILKEVYGVKRRHFNLMIELMDERIRASGKGDMEDPETLMYSEDEDDQEALGIVDAAEAVHPDYEPQEHILVVYEWLFTSQPVEYKKAVADVVKMINKHKHKAGKKQASRDKNRDKKAKQQVKQQKKQAKEAETQGESSADLLADLDAFMNNNPILQEIHDLRMKTVKKKLKLRKLLAAKRASPSESN